MKFALTMTSEYKIQLEDPENYKNHLIKIIEIENPQALENLLSYSQLVVDHTLTKLNMDADKIEIDAIKNANGDLN